MTRKEQRASAIAREKLIDKLLKSGKTCPQIAKQFGVETQRIYNFRYQAKRRKQLATGIALVKARIQEDRELAKKRPISLDPGQPVKAEKVFAELRDLLIRSEFQSRSFRHGIAETSVIFIRKTRQRGMPRNGVQILIDHLRSTYIRAGTTSLIRRREYTETGAANLQTWVFTFVEF